jgi:beta-N-acetylhexosaminidase
MSSHPAFSAGIFGCSGLSLTDEEKCFFTRIQPVGFILFARNCESPAQVRALTDSMREVAGRANVLILIDQEGGRVARLKPPHWRKTPPAKRFADCATHSLADGKRATWLNARFIAAELHTLGINVNCAPLADVPAAGSHDIIGDRAYGDEPYQVSILASAMANGLLDGGVLPVLKHIPGHGRATADSHEELPTVTASLDVLRETDFIPFKALSYLPLGMTAHIRYTAIDPELPATLSPAVIGLVRGELGYNGLLMSDDLSMKALGGSFAERTEQTIKAGCDLILHCNGNMTEMQEIADALTKLDDTAQVRLVRALAQLKTPMAFDAQGAGRELETLAPEPAGA